MSKSKSRKFADILSGNLATVLDDGIISASEVASLGTAATTDATAYATAAQGTTADNALPKAGGAMTGAITTNSTFDGRDIATDGAKLDGIETGATADQTAAQILTAIKTVDGASSGLDADLLDGQEGSYYTGYVDTAIANLSDSAPSTLNTLNELAAALGDDANFSTTVTNSIAAKLPLAGGTLTGDVLYGDSIKSKFGASSDLQIYHDGSNSYINETGTGDLYIKCNDEIRIQGQDDVNLIYAQQDGSVGLYYNGSNKFSTTNTGINVTGNITVTGTVDGRDVASDGTKLDTIETNATADQTDAEIRAAVEAATDSNVFTDADHTKLNSIEASADVTDTANVVSALTAGSNITIAANGTISSTDTNTTYSVQDGELSQNNFTNADHTKLNSIETNADVTDTTNVVAALTAGTNVSIASNGTISSTNTTYSVGDGGLTQKNFTTTLKSKLDGIESGATADQSASEISGLEEFVEDQIGANIIGGSNVSVSYNDSTGQTTLSSTDTNTTYSAGSGLGLSGTTFSHNDTSSQASVNNSGRTYIQDITLDTYGHITGITSATETVVNTDTNTTYNVGGGLTQSGTTFYHADTSSQGSINNSGSNFIQDITVDTYGHITGITSAAAGGLDMPSPVNFASPSQTISSSTTWTKPGSIGDNDWVTFYLVGGGASGFKSNGNGAGGGGGAAAVIQLLGSDITGSITMTIGAGGARRTGNPTYGIKGGTTSITMGGKTLYAYGGNYQIGIYGGSVGESVEGTWAVTYVGALPEGNSVTGGKARSTADIYYTGGATANGTNGYYFNTVFGGAGGGSVQSNNVISLPNESVYAGNGGFGGTGSTSGAGNAGGVTNGGDGQVPGGGGGATGVGAGGGDASGAGGNGNIRIYY